MTVTSADLPTASPIAIDWTYHGSKKSVNSPDCAMVGAMADNFV